MTAHVGGMDGLVAPITPSDVRGVERLRHRWPLSSLQADPCAGITPEQGCLSSGAAT
jgi:hypothetical protein